ncbi:MAG: hypothetical protein A2Y23_02185 [Clostridiales bacterium GWB2_37_7]|nr:MAG: hypothetical protein A2Y23_02185 [Clostridiales bacterium GWB2_37_7]
MKKVIFLCLIMVLLFSGCSEVSYLSEFPGIPIYPGTEMMLGKEFDNKVSVMYSDMSFKGDVEKVKSFFEKNIDKDIWTVTESEQPLSDHNVDKIYGYNLKSKEGNAMLTMAYTNSDKVGKNISITIIGDKIK